MADRAGDDSGIVIPFREPTDQDRGRIHERQRARALSMRLHPGSGAGRIKGDASDGTSVMDFKSVRRSHTITGAFARKFYTEAVRTEREPTMEIHFTETGMMATVLFWPAPA